MAARSSASGTISFGLVAIPVKFFVSAQGSSISFNQITPAGNRTKQVIKDSVTDEEVSRGELLKGFEYTKGKYITFSSAEIKALEEEGSGSIEIQEFVPAETVDLLCVEKTYYLGPDKGGDKPYLLLTKALQHKGMYAVAQWKNRGKQHLVVIRPYKDNLVVHQMFYADEVRDFDANCAKMNVSDAELDLACKLMDSLAKPSFDATQYTDTYKERVLKAVEQKKKGEEVTIEEEAPPAADTNDLMAALMASLGTK